MMVNWLKRHPGSPRIPKVVFAAKHIELMVQVFAVMDMEWNLDLLIRPQPAMPMGRCRS